MNEDRKSINAVIQILTDEELGDDVKLKGALVLKKFFLHSSSTNWCKVSVESLLNESYRLRKEKQYCFEKDFLLKYGKSLIEFSANCDSPDSEALLELEYVLSEFSNNDKSLAQELLERIWNKFQIGWRVRDTFMSKVMQFSEKIIEEKILNWIENKTLANEMNLLVSFSVDSPEVFQMVSLILQGILIKAQGHELILKMITYFVARVMSNCCNKQKNFLKLYPRNWCRLVTILINPPGLYTKGLKDKALELLFEKFSENPKTALLLMSHYPDWLIDFKLYLVKRVPS